MPIQIQGSAGGLIDVNGTTFDAVCVTMRPVDYGFLGQYSISMLTGTMAAGIADFSTIFYARWTATPQIALVWGVALNGVVGGLTGFTAGYGYFGLRVLRNMAVDGSGGALAVLTGNSQNLRSSMAPSKMGTIRMSTTAALTLDVSSGDAQGIGQTYFGLGTATSVTYVKQIGLYGSATLEDGGNPAPVVLAQNEGVLVSVRMPATGTWATGVNMSWSEVDSY